MINRKRVDAEIAALMSVNGFTVRGIRAVPGKKFIPNGPGFGEPNFPSAKKAADRMQEEFNADADPVRVYVFDADGIAIYAAHSRRRHWQQ